MINDDNVTWLKEFLNGLVSSDADKETVAEIVDTFKSLWRVVRAAMPVTQKPPAVYLPNSRKDALQEALKPFMPRPKEPNDGSPRTFNPHANVPPGR